MKAHCICICALLVFAGPLSSRLNAGELTIQDAWQRAEQAHPRATELSLQDSIHLLRDADIRSTWLPRLMLNARATWQSETAEIDIPIPGIDIPQPPTTNYALALNLQQNIYDGGRSSARHQINSAEADVNKLHLAGILYQIRADVNSAFFNSLTLQEDASILAAQNTILQANIKDMQSRLQQGVIVPALIEQLQAELLRLRQRQIGLRRQRAIALDRLTTFLGQTIDSQTVLTSLLQADTNARRRPEQALFAAQSHKLQRLQVLQSAQRKPQLAAFGDAAFGRPGYNVFAEDPHFYSMLGIQLQWNFWDWGRAERQLNILQLQQMAVERQRADFERRRSLAMREVIENINTLDEQLQLDVSIIDLRQSIAARTAKRLNQGVINAYDYLNDLRELENAQLQNNRRRVERERLLATLHFLAGE